ncbi:hypothetical protein AMAG_11710 [Allomyces macrogynus ATCC 38327]|uniref:Uncharacterized protein n=1 Tax=Allomyces macrogynus (strain ATCC 38327) TaxID=578462 RepID=A0A0L0SW76_ALLM3|nr:hypothetical protein AMAG_11710 [Allomyces macrogynus ATCC 38327]|eukprot:KNE66589.1 hypothetical protein AMAG_11710 [Allomyces macrogynus ATCC 38327]
MTDTASAKARDSAPVAELQQEQAASSSRAAPASSSADRVTQRWLGILRHGLMGYTVLAAVFFIVTAVNMGMHLLPTKNDETEGTSVSDLFVDQFYFMTQQVSGWSYAALTLAVIGVVMSVFGFVAFLKRHTTLCYIYFIWSALHVAVWAVVMVVTLLLMAREYPGTHIISDPKPANIADAKTAWVVLLTVLLPDFVLWTAVRVAAAYFSWVFYTETKLAQGEIPIALGVKASAPAA